MNRFDKNIKLNILLAGIILITSAGPVLTQSTVEMDRQAQEYFDNKDFSKAVALWLNILDIEPENQEIQKKVEFLYEMKQKKDLELEKAKLNYKLAKKDLAPNFDDKTTFEDAEKNLDKTKEKSKIAFASFITAYRIDPKDPEMQLIREDMQKLEKTIAAEDKRLKSSREIREKVAALLLIARAAMDESRFQEALKNWSDILKLMPEHLEATEGKRQAGIAIENILRYENIKKYMASGILFFGQEEYKPARQDFMSVLQLDPENSSARDYIEKIDDKLNEKKRYEQRLREAETFYASGRKNIRDNKYDEARDDLENALSLIENFKDARQLLLGLPGLKAEYDRREREKRLRMIDEQFQNGLIALADSRYQDAIAAFENTLKLDPENKLAPPYIQRAKDAQKLVEEEVVDDNSPYFNVVNSLIVSGKTLYDSGKYEESKNRWEQILQLFPSNRIANEYMFKCELKLKPEQREIMVKKFIDEGEAFLKKREYRNAYRRFELVRSIEPDYPDIKNLLARAERGQSYSGASAVAQEDIQEIERRFNLGMAYYQRGGEDNIKKALVELRWVAGKDPNNIKAVVSVNKIEAQLRVGTSTAKAGGSKLTPEQESLVRKYYYSGINYYSNNDFKRAIAEWRKVLAIDPSHDRAKNNIRKTLVLLGR